MKCKNEGWLWIFQGLLALMLVILSNRIMRLKDRLYFIMLLHNGPNHTEILFGGKKTDNKSLTVVDSIWDSRSLKNNRERPN